MGLVWIVLGFACVPFAGACIQRRRLTREVIAEAEQARSLD